MADYYLLMHFLNGGLLFIYLFIYFVVYLKRVVCGTVTRLRTVRSGVQIAATNFFYSRTPRPILKPN